MKLIAGFTTGRRKALLKLCCLIIIIILANLAVEWLADALKFEYRPKNEDMVHRMIMVSALAYALLISIPFVPGVEIGLTLIGMMGPSILPLVYLSTIVGLLTSFVIGRLISLKALIRLLESFHFHKASQLLASIEPLKKEARLSFLVSKTPSRLVPFLIRHRYIALAVLVNLPGNILVGGGGGLSLIAGASKLFSPIGFIITIAVAVSPVPLAILFFGSKALPGT